MTFDITKRDMWDWVITAPEDVPETWADNGYAINPADPGSYLFFEDGRPFVKPCPAGMVFNPITEAGPVADWPADSTEADIYAWAVAKGFVRDQR
ncbi:carbohydrate-binding module family 14 protein [Streptomyces mexicanus]|uniref:carbohydrate-binding module family 14 protein n=1 Tax=Streptomyces mexicanus TaxID=178566 RepID=UPI003649AF50